MKIKMLQSMVTNHGCYRCKEVVDWPEHEAKRLIVAGIAQQVEQEPEVETASVDKTPELAVKTTKRKRKATKE